MRPLSEAEKYWQRLEQYHSLTDLKISVSSHKEPLITAGLRSVCWKIFLLFKSLDRSIWPAKLHEARTTYNSLRSHYLRAIEHPDEFDSSVDPLSENEESPWVALRADETLRAEIFQDIERCMPDNVYFRQPATQNMMLDILFVWCKMHPEIGYRQGMHEILAPLLWVVERDAVEEEGEGILAAMLNSRCIEQDAYTLFALIMKTAKSFYAPAESGAASKDTPMLTRSARIFDSYLPKVDPALSAHLIRLEIVPQIFLLRWIRLLFGREFPLDSVLDMWDALFAIDSTLELVDMISVSMLLRIRWKLVAADTNEAFSLLLRYPEPDAPAYTFIKDALYLRDNLSPEGGVEIITRYGERAPLLQPRTPEIRAPSPALSFVSSRTRHTLGSPRAFASPQGGGLESLLQNAARGVIDRGSQWAVGKAIRDAVGEVKKNMEAYQSVSPSGQSTPRSGGREFRKPSRVATGSNGGLGPERAAAAHASASVARKMEALEKRNKSLAKMLEGVVAELWEYHEERTEAVGKEGKDDEEREKLKEREKEGIEKLSLAIAKVQFVQVYLEDATIPLPAEEEGSESQQNTSGIASPPVPERTASAPPVTDRVVPVQSTTLSHRSRGTGSVDAGTAKADTTHADTNRLVSAASAAEHRSRSPPTNTTSFNARPRPHLASSSFSWMLGQEDAEKDSRSTFAKASEHSALASDEKRRIRKGKGFLFGEEGEDEEDEGGQAGGRTMAIGTGKARGKRGSVSGSGSAGKGKGVGGSEEGFLAGMVEEEVIDLDEVGGKRGVF